MHCVEIAGVHISSISTQMRGSNDSLRIAAKPKAVYRPHAAAILFPYMLQRLPENNS